MSHNGWKNRATWNVSLWALNDEPTYGALVDYVSGANRPTWDGFADYAGLPERTPDGILWRGRGLDRRELGAMLREIRAEMRGP